MIEKEPAQRDFHFTEDDTFVVVVMRKDKDGKGFLFEKDIQVRGVILDGIAVAVELNRVSKYIARHVKDSCKECVDTCEGCKDDIATA